jgi:heme/copper-type cytochrome/quinol oxidase subunit 2
MTTHEPNPEARKAVIDRENEAFGGVKIFCAFFGWLTATGMTVLLTALVAAAGAGVGLASDASDIADAANDRGVSAEQIGWAGVVLVLVIVFVSYYSGGYVAGRMARFDGIRQGLAVFGWTVFIAIVIAVLGAVAGSKYDVLDELNSFPRIPNDLSDLSLEAVVVLVGVIAAALVGAMVGGLAGMHFHRKVDRTGLGR